MSYTWSQQINIAGRVNLCTLYHPCMHKQRDIILAIPQLFHYASRRIQVTEYHIYYNLVLGFWLMLIHRSHNICLQRSTTVMYYYAYSYNKYSYSSLQQHVTNVVYPNYRRRWFEECGKFKGMCYVVDGSKGPLWNRLALLLPHHNIIFICLIYLFSYTHLHRLLLFVIASAI